MPRRDPLTGVAAAAAPRLGAAGTAVPGAKKPKKKLTPQERRALLYPNVTAKCADGCLDRILVSIRHKRDHKLPVVGGKLRGMGAGGAASAIFPHTQAGAAVPLPRYGAPMLLLGILSGSAPRREVLRCTWMRNPALAEGGVRILFVVGKLSAESSPDVLPVDVKEGAFMRSKNDKANETRSFDPKKLIRTGSVTTYWKLVAWLRYATTAPEPMIARADDDVFISPRMLISHARLLLKARGELVYAGVFEWYSWRTRTLMSTGFGLSAGASRTRRRKWRNCTASGAGSAPDDPCTGPVAFAKGPLVMYSRAAVRAVVASPLVRPPPPDGLVWPRPSPTTRSPFGASSFPLVASASATAPRAGATPRSPPSACRAFAAV